MVAQDVAEGVVSEGEFRGVFDGLAVGGNGLVQLRLALQGVADVQASSGMLRVEFDGPAEAGGGSLVVVLAVAEDGPQVKVGGGRVRTNGHGRSEVPNRPVVVLDL